MAAMAARKRTLTQKDFFDLTNERPVAFNPAFAKITGSVAAGLLLSQFVYWSEKKNNGWFFKTISEIEKETSLSRYEQETAIKKLKELGILEVMVKGTPPKRHFKINADAIVSLWKSDKPISENPENQFVGIPQINLLESRKSICWNPANQFVGIQQIHYSYITTYNTTDNTTDISKAKTVNLTNSPKCNQSISGVYYLDIQNNSDIQNNTDIQIQNNSDTQYNTDIQNNPATQKKPENQMDAETEKKSESQKSGYGEGFGCLRLRRLVKHTLSEFERLWGFKPLDKQEQAKTAALNLIKQLAEAVKRSGRQISNKTLKGVVTLYLEWNASQSWSAKTKKLETLRSKLPIFLAKNKLNQHEKQNS